MRRFWGLLAGLSVTAGLLLVEPAGTVAAGAGNIPGVPLPGPVVSGQLGGPIYDVVYSVDLPAARVLLLSLTGTPGTDFDLYLFDATASNIYAQPAVGLVASSTGPTSTEFIQYPSAGGGYFYIDVSGATNVEGTFRLSVQVSADTVPPNVTLTLDGGAPATSDATVTATVIATDDLSGVVGVQFSADGSNWSAWLPYQSSASWNFPSGDGSKTLWVRARDGAGNVSKPAHATIMLLTTRPLVVKRDPDPASPITGPLPTIRVTFSEPIRVSSWLNAGLLLQDASGTLIYGTYAWNPATNTGSFTPGAPLVPGAPYSISLGSVVDEAGNPLVPIGSWVVRPMNLPVVSLTVSPRIAATGSTVALSGQVVGGAGSPVVIAQAVGGGPWEPYATVFPTPGGSYATGATIEVNSAFRATVPASSVSAEAASGLVRVLVRRVVRLEGVSSALAHQVVAGTRVTLTAVVGPSEPTEPVTLSIYRYVMGRGYVLQVAVSRLTVRGRHSFSWHPARGSYNIRLTTTSTALFANGISPTYRWVAS